jgi:CRP-like cAMP-binding protein
MIAPLLLKLDDLILLSDEEKRALIEAEAVVRQIDPRTDIVVEGEPRESVHLVIEGFACRYTLLPDGRRQIVSCLLPGDLCDARMFLLDRVDHSIGTLARSTIAIWPRQTMLRLAETHPGIMRAFWWSTFIEESVTREWLVNVGQRTALERLSHLICEIYCRLQIVEKTRGASFELPITQAELADTLGLSVVHVNRTLQELRRDHLVALTGKVLTILDFEMLKAIAMFNPRYLGPGRGKAAPADRQGDKTGERRSTGERVHLRGKNI